MADIFLTVVPVSPTVPKLEPTTNKNRTSNVRAPYAHDTFTALYKERSRRRVLPSIPDDTEI